MKPYSVNISASVSNWKHTGLLLISLDSFHSVFCDSIDCTCTWTTFFPSWPRRPILWHWFQLAGHDKSMCVYPQREQPYGFFFFWFSMLWNKFLSMFIVACGNSGNRFVRLCRFPKLGCLNWGLLHVLEKNISHLVLSNYILSKERRLMFAWSITTQPLPNCCKNVSFDLFITIDNGLNNSYLIP